MLAFLVLPLVSSRSAFQEAGRLEPKNTDNPCVGARVEDMKLEKVLDATDCILMDLPGYADMELNFEVGKLKPKQPPKDAKQPPKDAPKVVYTGECKSRLAQKAKAKDQAEETVLMQGTQANVCFGPSQLQEKPKVTWSLASLKDLYTFAMWDIDQPFGQDNPDNPAGAFLHLVVENIGPSKEMIEENLTKRKEALANGDTPSFVGGGAALYISRNIVAGSRKGAHSIRASRTRVQQH